MNGIRLSQEYILYRPLDQAAYPIQVTDWENLKKKIKSIVPHRSIFSTLSSAFFGVFASSIFGLLGFIVATGIPSWILHTGWIIFWLSLALGCSFLYLDSLQRKIIVTSVNEIVEEMEQLEKCFEQPPMNANMTNQKSAVA
jgi:hypothetical protein